MLIRESDFDALAACLSDAGLPTSDLRGSDRRFYRVEVAGLIGYGGIEGVGPDRILRSFVLLPEHRGKGVGGRVLALIETEAERSGVARLHLLTTSAARFFRTQGYIDEDRAAAPAAISASAEFTSLCPASAAYLVKNLKVAS